MVQAKHIIRRYYIEIKNNKFVCKNCKKNIKGGVTNLKNHLRRIHPSIFLKFQKQANVKPYKKKKKMSPYYVNLLRKENKKLKVN